MYVVAITGASGAIIGLRLIQFLLEKGLSVGAVVSDAGWKTIEYEIFRGKRKPESIEAVLAEIDYKGRFSNLHEYNNSDFFTPIASGTGLWDALIVAPASMKTLAAIAAGYADTVITRGADVALKEGKPCILVPRETPLSLIHLKNMVRVKEAGAILVPPVPAFYIFPETVDDIINFIIAKIASQLGIDHDLIPNWASREDHEK